MKNFYLLTNKENQLSSLKEGFSWSAFVFGPLWLLYYRLWQKLSIYIIANSVFSILNYLKIISYKQLFCLELLTLFFIANFAFEFLFSKLQKEGYIVRNIICANTEVEARFKFYQNLEEEKKNDL
jgi:hypothetical protein